MIVRIFSPINPNFTVIHSTLAVTLAEDAVALGVTDTYWSPEYWTSFDDNATFPDNTDWFIPGIPHLRGGVANNYSEYFRDACDVYFEHLQVNTNGQTYSNFRHPTVLTINHHRSDFLAMAIVAQLVPYFLVICRNSYVIRCSCFSPQRMVLRP